MNKVASNAYTALDVGDAGGVRHGGAGGAGDRAAPRQPHSGTAAQLLLAGNT